MASTPCTSRYTSTYGPTAGTVVACRQTGAHLVHSNLADGDALVTWLSGDDDVLAEETAAPGKQPPADRSAAADTLLDSVWAVRPNPDLGCWQVINENGAVIADLVLAEAYAQRIVDDHNYVFRGWS